MFVLRNHPVVRIDQAERQTTELGTLTPVGATPETSLADVALPAITYTERSVHKDFQRHVGTSLMYLADLPQRKFTRQHHLAEARIGQKSHFLCRTVIHLRARMQRNGRQLQTGDSHILHNKRIHSDTVQGPDHLLRLLQFFIFQDRIDRDINPHIIQMGILHQSGYIFQ